MNKLLGVWTLALVAGVVCANYRSDGGFMPSASYQRTEDQLAEPSEAKSREDPRESRDPRDRDQAERTQRFGVSAYGNSGGAVQPDEFQGPYGGTAPGLYGPVKIDLGGVLLGSILGFGAVLVLPKLIHAFSYGYGGYGRSAETSLLDVSEMLTRVDETLSRYNIDSAACTQRLACSYVQLASENMVTGNATDFDALLSGLATNTLVRRMLDGTSILEAISNGKSTDTNCEKLYPKCKLDRKTIVKMLTQLVPS